MSVHISFDLPDATYRELVKRAETEGVQVKTLLRRALMATATGWDVFAEWCLTVDPVRVQREKTFLPPEVMNRLIYDRETERLRAYLRAEQRTERTKAA